MFKRLINSLNKRFSTELQDVYSIKYKVKDVVKMRGLSTNQPHVYIENQRIDIPVNKMLLDMIKQLPFSNPNQVPKATILDIQLNYLHPTASTLSILKKIFYIKIQNDLYLVANNQSLIRQSYNPQYIAMDAPQSLQPIVRQNINSLDKLNDIRPINLNTMIIKNVLDNSIIFKIQKIRLKQLLKVIQNKIKQFQTQIKILDQQILKKSIKKTKFFSTFIITQYAFVHWLIYFHLSWDIMQPITVLLTNLDILIGYYFFVFKGKQYTLEQIQKTIYQKHKYKYLKKYGVNVQKFQELLELRDYFQMRLDLYTKSPNVLMDRLQQPIKLLDTR